MSAVEQNSKTPQNELPSYLLDTISYRFANFIANLPDPAEPHESMNKMDFLSSAFQRTIPLATAYVHLFPEARQQTDQLVLSFRNTYTAACEEYDDRKTINDIKEAYALYLLGTNRPQEAIHYWKDEHTIDENVSARLSAAFIRNGHINDGLTIAKEITSKVYQFATYRRLIDWYEEQGTLQDLLKVEQDLDHWFLPVAEEDPRYGKEYERLKELLSFDKTFYTPDDPDRAMEVFLATLEVPKDKIFYQEKLIRRLLKQKNIDVPRVTRLSKKLLHDLHEYTDYEYDGRQYTDTWDLGTFSSAGNIAKKERWELSFHQHFQTRINIVRRLLRHPQLHPLIDAYVHSSDKFPHPPLQSLLEKERQPSKDHWHVLFDCIQLRNGIEASHQIYTHALEIFPDDQDELTIAYAHSLAAVEPQAATHQLQTIEDEYVRTEGYIYVLPVIYHATKQYTSVSKFISESVLYEHIMTAVETVANDWNIDDIVSPPEIEEEQSEEEWLEEQRAKFSPYVPYLLSSLLVQSLGMNDMQTTNIILNHSAFPDWALPEALMTIHQWHATGELPATLEDL